MYWCIGDIITSDYYKQAVTSAWDYFFYFPRTLSFEFEKNHQQEFLFLSPLFMMRWYHSCSLVASYYFENTNFYSILFILLLINKISRWFWNFFFNAKDKLCFLLNSILKARSLLILFGDMNDVLNIIICVYICAKVFKMYTSFLSK